MGQSLRGLSWLSNTRVMQRLGLDEDRVSSLLYGGAKATMTVAARASKRARAAVKLLKPDRMRPAQSEASPELFDVTFSESQEMLRETMERFAKERLRPGALEADEKSAPPEGFLEECHELGLTHLAIPESVGGAGEARSVVTNVLVAEELARGDMGLAFAALAPLGIVHALVDFGTAEQQGTYLPSFVGEKPYPAALAVLESRPLFDPNALFTRAVRDGGAYVLSGEKVMVPLAEDAELFLVLADLEGKPEAFLIDKGTAGLTVTKEPTMGLRAAKLGRLKLERVRVAKEKRLGGESPLDAARLIDLSRIAWGAMTVGTCQAMLDYTKVYVNDRIAFGEPISYRQSVAFMVADIAVELEGMRLMVYRAASRADADRSFRREASLARIQCAEKGMQIGTNGVQVLGGHGFIKEHPVELWYRQLRAIGVLEGGLLV